MQVQRADIKGQKMNDIEMREVKEQRRDKRKFNLTKDLERDSSYPLNRSVHDLEHA